MSCGVGHRRSSDTALLWLWHRPAAVAPIRPLAWEPPYAAGAALKKTKDQKKKRSLDSGVCLSETMVNSTECALCVIIVCINNRIFLVFQ